MTNDQTAAHNTAASSLPDLANSTTPLRVAVVGSGPAGIYASDALMKSGRDVAIDLYERLPVPFGLIRYGVAPDHPRIKGIIKSLHRVMDKPEIRLLGNVDVGKDVTVDGHGNGPLAAYANALEKLGIDVEIQEYNQHARTSGDDAEAAAYVLAEVNGRKVWGVGIAGSITYASLKAVTSAVNRALDVNHEAVLAGGV